MLRVVASENESLRESFVRALALEKVDDTPIATQYRKGDWIYLNLHTPLSVDTAHWIASTFLPERLYLPVTSYSIDLVHEVGDVIVPNVFLTYDSTLESVELTEDNRDSILGGAKFLETFLEQKDYYVEDFGLSLGGIVVDRSPLDPSDELASKLMMCYEADAYTPDTLAQAHAIVIDNQIPALILLSITKGKNHPKYKEMNPLDLATKNLITTMKLLEDEE